MTHPFARQINRARREIEQKSSAATSEPSKEATGAAETALAEIAAGRLPITSAGEGPLARIIDAAYKPMLDRINDIADRDGKDYSDLLKARRDLVEGYTDLISLARATMTHAESERNPDEELKEHEALIAQHGDTTDGK